MNALCESPGQAPKYHPFLIPWSRTAKFCHVRAAGLHPIVRGLASGTHYASANGDRNHPFPASTESAFSMTAAACISSLCAGPGEPWPSSPLLRAKCASRSRTSCDVKAAAIANPGMSAWLSLKERAALAAGETVLIMGATGVAGQLAIQTARLLGASA